MWRRHRDRHGSNDRRLICVIRSNTKAATAAFALDGVDYGQYLQELREAAGKYGCAAHAFVLMTNHVHLLVTPAGAGNVSRMMQAIERRDVGSFNARYRRTGTLWGGKRPIAT